MLENFSKKKLLEIPKRFSVCVFKSPSLRRCYLTFENQKTWSNNKNIRICCSKYLMMLNNGMSSTRKIAILQCIITSYAVLTFALNRAGSTYLGKNIGIRNLLWVSIYGILVGMNLSIIMSYIHFDSFLSKRMNNIRRRV